MLRRPPLSPPSSASKRQRRRERRRLAQRRYRQNVADHAVIVPVKVGPSLLDYLVRVVRWLDEADAKDARKIGEAITRGLMEAAEADAAKR
ncbi:hypothetical protein ABIG06_004723 [Bradyrhizobium sp. USDA 326]